MGSDGSHSIRGAGTIVLAAGSSASLVPALTSMGNTFVCITDEPPKVDINTLIGESVLIRNYDTEPLAYTVVDEIGADLPMSNRPHGWYREAFKKKGKRR